MSGTTWGRRLAGAIGPALALGALIYGGFNLWIAVDPDDTENLEMTRVLAAARQFTAGPSSLYGPYSGANPYVLIQAPLYYRLTGLLAWPLVAAGVGPVSACCAAGRLISLLSFVVCLLMARRLATLDGAPARAGAWAVLLAVGAPLVGSYPVTMRPDMLGVALQTLGMTLVLRVVLREGGAAFPARAGRMIAVAYAAFALALCVKQHYLVGPAVSTLLLARAWWREGLRLQPILAAHGLAVLICTLVYGFELGLTRGMLLRSAFAVPGELKAVTAGSWAHIGLVATTTLKRGAGLALLGAACVLTTTRRTRGGRLDALLVAFVVPELAVMVKLCLDSSGGWYNYALQSAVCGAVLIGRALERRLAGEVDARRWVPLGLAALALVAADARTVAIGVATRRELRRDLGAILATPAVAAGRARGEVYFAGPLQAYNPRGGRGELAHDEWLYGAFEAVSAAEPRARWLRSALTAGPVRVVVAPESDPKTRGTVAGVPEPLPRLGYRRVARSGEFAVWVRR